MTAKEALEAIRKEFQNRLDFPVNLTPEYRLVKQSLDELEKLKKSDASKEQSSIDYFNEFKRIERELEGLKKLISKYFETLKAGEIFKNPLEQNALYLNIMKIVGGKNE